LAKVHAGSRSGEAQMPHRLLLHPSENRRELNSASEHSRSCRLMDAACALMLRTATRCAFIIMLNFPSG